LSLVRRLAAFMSVTIQGEDDTAYESQLCGCVRGVRWHRTHNGKLGDHLAPLLVAEASMVLAAGLLALEIHPGDVIHHTEREAVVSQIARAE
jgi:hypothetical protein